MDYILDRLILEYYYSVILCFQLLQSGSRHLSLWQQSAISPASQQFETLRTIDISRRFKGKFEMMKPFSMANRTVFDVGSRMAHRYVGRICLVVYRMQHRLLHFLPGGILISLPSKIDWVYTLTAVWRSAD